MSKLRKALNYLEILKEAINLPLANPKLILSIVFSVLFPSSLILLAINKLNLLPTFELKRGDQVTLQIELVRDTLQWLTTTLAISMISKAYIEKPSSILQLLSSLQRQWKNIIVTSIFSELIAFNCSSLLLVLGYPPKATGFSTFVVAVVGFCVLITVHLACQLSLVVSSVEERCYGLLALRRAMEIINGRKIQSLVLMGLIFLLDSLLNVVPIGIVFQLLWCSVYCMLYLESKKRRITQEDELRWII